MTGKLTFVASLAVLALAVVLFWGDAPSSATGSDQPGPPETLSDETNSTGVKDGIRYNPPADEFPLELRELVRLLESSPFGDDRVGLHYYEGRSTYVVPVKDLTEAEISLLETHSTTDLVVAPVEAKATHNEMRNADAALSRIVARQKDRFVTKHGDKITWIRVTSTLTAPNRIWVTAGVDGVREHQADRLRKRITVRFERWQAKNEVSIDFSVIDASKSAGPWVKKTYLNDQ